VNPQHQTRLLSYVDHVARLRAKLAADLLARPENADQAAAARAWGDRERRAS